MVDLDKIKIMLDGFVFFVVLIYFLYLKTKPNVIEYNPNPAPNEVFIEELKKEYKIDPDDSSFLNYSLVILLVSIICLAAGFLINFIYLILGMLLFGISGLLLILYCMVGFSKSNARTNNALKSTIDRTNDEKTKRLVITQKLGSIGPFIALIIAIAYVVLFGK